MDVVSYRGPGVAGGVSSGLGRAWLHHSQDNSMWWFLKQGVLQSLGCGSEKSKFVSLLPDSTVSGHYGFCNEFLWPLMHDLPQFATYSAEQHEQYNVFNRLVSEQIDVESANKQAFFVQDYQLAMVPGWLSLYGHKTVAFWHIPWPRHVDPLHVELIRELACGLLGSSALGFHTGEYAQNFVNFVKDHLLEYKVNLETLTVEKNANRQLQSRRRWGRPAHRTYVLQQSKPEKTGLNSATKILVHPLGIDMEFWKQQAESSRSLHVDPQLLRLANSIFVLSVDRVDYTKSVLERLLIIDKFFELHPEWIGNLSFVQVCARSRPGLPAFDQYWHSCRALAAAVNSRWCQNDWQPVEWIDQALDSAELAYLYTHARSLLVNPVRDGLNLIAKEFVACQDRQPGMLLLSPGAGVVHELGKYALGASPHDCRSTVESLMRSLTMSLSERSWRMHEMKTILSSNQILHWWSTFSRAMHQSRIDAYITGENVYKRSLA